MEFYARYAHKELWHGPALWHVHETHHRPGARAVFEFNDIFGSVVVKLGFFRAFFNFN
jgi:hypothetical protein